MASGWLYQDGQRTVGPVAPTNLIRLLRAGTITADTLVRKAPDGKWLRAAKVKGLFDQPPAAAAPRTEGFFAYWTASWRASRGGWLLPLLLLPAVSALKPLLTWWGLWAIVGGLVAVTVAARLLFAAWHLGAYWFAGARDVPPRRFSLLARVGAGSLVLLLPLAALAAAETFAPPEGLLASAVPAVRAGQDRLLALAGVARGPVEVTPLNAIEVEVTTTAVSLCDVGVRLLGEEARKDP